MTGVDFLISFQTTGISLQNGYTRRTPGLSDATASCDRGRYTRVPRWNETRETKRYHCATGSVHFSRPHVHLNFLFFFVVFRHSLSLTLSLGLVKMYAFVNGPSWALTGKLAVHESSGPWTCARVIEVGRRCR